MKRYHLWKILVVALFCGIGVALAADDPADTFLRGYQEFQNAEKLERDGNKKDALAKYRFAASLFEQIRRDHADWQQLVVEYRLKKTGENIARLEPEVAAGGPAGDFPEGPLPQSDHAAPPASDGGGGGMPTVISAPPLANERSSREPESSPGQVSSTSIATSEIKSLRKQLKSAKQETADLSQKLDETAANLKSARLEVDKTKVNVVELKAQIEQLQTQVDDAKTDPRSVQRFKQEQADKIVALQKAVAAARAEKEVVEEDNARLFTKLEAAANYIKSADESLALFARQRTELIQSGMRSAGERDAAIKEKSTVEAERDSAMKAKEKAAKERDKMADEKEGLAKERDQALAKLKRAKDSTAEIEKLSAENKSLAEKLAETEKKLGELNTALPQKEEELTKVKSDLNSVNDRMVTLQSEIANRDTKISSLEKQLDETSGELAKLRLNPVATPEEKNMAAENQLLKGIVMRQLKEEARREQARKLVQEELDRLQLKSSELGNQVNVLSAPLIELTADEKALFREPTMALSEPSDSRMEVAVAVAKPDAKEGGAPAADDGKAVPPPAPAEPVVPDEVKPMVEKAKKLFSLQNYAEAEKLYQEIVERAPRSYFALSNLGIVQIQLNKLAAAEVALKKAVEINPNDSFAQTGLGFLYYRKEKFPEAVATLTNSIKLNDSDYMAHNYLGIALVEKGDRKAGEKEILRAIEIKPDYAVAHFNLAVLYATSEPPSKELARHHYTKATELGSPPDASLERLIQ